jgi:hypothetical protein
MIKINYRTLDQAVNFWELNPQFKIYPPFHLLYEKDKSKDKDFSSRQMWTIFFMCDPDENDNIFYRIAYGERKKTLSETFVKDLDWDDANFVKCLEAYPLECMTAVQRAYAEEKNQLQKRAKLISDTELTLDTTTFLEGKVIVIKGTATQINMLQKDSLSIYQKYQKIEEEFIKDKQSVRAKGGSKLTKSEKGDLW